MSKRHLFGAAALAAFAVLGYHVAGRHIAKSSSNASATVPAARVPAIYRALRPKYPYSVISGGAYSPAELRASTAKDPVVRAHYATFDIARARLVSTTSDRYQYVSFRLHNQVFWTHKKLRIPKGELLLTDGQHCARTRCGNRLSDTPLGPTTRSEPSETALSLPPYELGMQPTFELSDAVETDRLPSQSLPINSILFSPAFVLAEDTYLQRPASSPYVSGNSGMFWPGPGYLSGLASGVATKTASGADSSSVGLAGGPGTAVIAAAAPAAAPEPGTFGLFCSAIFLCIAVAAMRSRSARRPAS